MSSVGVLSRPPLIQPSVSSFCLRRLGRNSSLSSAAILATAPEFLGNFATRSRTWSQDSLMWP